MALGVYLHIPFCRSKCPYCDFYSFVPDEQTMDRYTDALCAALHRHGESLGRTADTLYLGGGTPSLLGPRRLSAILAAAHAAFGLTDAEITMEVNPGDPLPELLRAFADGGGNRLSMGLQAGTDTGLRTLGRRHSVEDARRAAEAVARAGIPHLSLDLMLAWPHQTEQDVTDTVSLIRDLGADHGSAYLLKIEPHTPFASQNLPLPDEDTAADLYLAAVAAFEAAGFSQYEISNFAKAGGQSRHNLKYWNSDETLGLGPAASSFLGGKRTTYPRDIARFLAGEMPPEDPPTAVPSGSPTEYAMLRLRLTEGLTERGFRARFGTALPAVWRQAAQKLPPTLVKADETGIRLTPEGFLVSNAILAEVLC